MPNPISRFGEALYSLATSILHAAGFRAGTPVDWRWTVRDPLGNGDEQIIEHFKRYMRNEGIKAGQFAMFRNSTLTQSLAFTWAEDGYRTTETDSLFRIASCSKIFATAALREAVALTGTPADAKVFKILGLTGTPQDDRIDQITIEHLIGHRGGWNYRDGTNGNLPRPDPVFNLRHIGRTMGLDHPPNAEEFSRYVHDRIALDFDPGQHESYSNLGFVLIGRVIEKLIERVPGLEGMSYFDFVKARLLQPLGITDVSVGGTALRDRVDREVLYEDPGLGPDVCGDPQRPAASVPLPYGGMGAKLDVMAAGGGLITTATSLATFIRSYNHGAKSVNTSSQSQEVAGRSPGAPRRYGSMPGTSSACGAFDGKTVGAMTETFEYAVVFNRMPRLSIKNGDDPIATFDRFCDTLQDLMRAKFT